MNKIILILSVIVVFGSCLDKNDDVICTEIFAAVTIEVNGVFIDDFYTVRPSTGDTIRHEDVFGNNIFTVLDDNYLSKLKNDQDSFILKGYFEGQEKISEEFVISADECHVSKISGKEVVNL